MKKVLFLLCLTAVLLSCGSSAVSVRQTRQIQTGMSKNEVLNILGSPNNQHFNGSEEIWQYRVRSSSRSEAIRSFTVWFENNRVTRLTSDSNSTQDNRNYDFDRRTRQDRDRDRDRDR
jgi:outer membrane protein assembly factor BamE (lipoprotein component of BamABCDE complex)